MGALASVIPAWLSRGRLAFHDFAYDGLLERAEIRRGLARVLRMRHLHEHAGFVRDFETEFAASLGGVPALAVASGTDALYMALRQAGVGPGREVITCPNTWVTTLSTVHELGGHCHFVDIDRQTGLLDPTQVPAAIGLTTVAVLPIHMYGSMVPMAGLMRMAHDAGLSVIEDACQAVGASCDGRAAGAWGDAGCFSFHATKLVGAPGDGGMLVTPHAVWQQDFRRDAIVQWDQALVLAQARVPSRLSALHVPFLRARLRRLATRIAGRARQWHRYREGLKGLQHGRLLTHAPGVAPAFRNCILVSRHKKAIADECRHVGIPVEEIYPGSLAFVQRLAAQGFVLPNALELAADNLSLPLGRQMSDRRIDQVIDIVSRHDRASALATN